MANGGNILQPLKELIKPVDSQLSCLTPLFFQHPPTIVDLYPLPAHNRANYILCRLNTGLFHFIFSFVTLLLLFSVFVA